MTRFKTPLVLFFLIILAWSIYRFFSSYPEWIDELIAKPLLMLAPTLLTVAFFEKRKLSSIGLTTSHFLRNSLFGLFVGTVLVIELVVISWIRNGYSIHLASIDSLFGVLLLVGVSFATAFVEETVYRGYFFSRFLLFFKNEIFANVGSTVFFVTVHLPILFLHNTSLSSMGLPIAQLSIMSLISGFLFARTKSIVPSTITHAVWNASVFLVQ